MPEVDAGDWPGLAPRFSALQDEPLTPGEVAGWLRRWSDLQLPVWEPGRLIAPPWLSAIRAHCKSCTVPPVLACRSRPAS